MLIRGLFGTLHGLGSRLCGAALRAAPRPGREVMSPNLPRDLLDARNQLVDRFLHRHLLADDAVHRLRPHILVVENRELVVLGKIERLGAAGELVVDRLAMAVVLPERALLAFEGRREPAAECAFDIGAKVFFLKQEGDELLRLGLVLGRGEDYAGLDVGAVLDRLTVR